MLGYYQLREAIIDKINEEIEKSGDPQITKVAGAYWAPSDIEGQPAVVVTPDNMESSYENTSGGRRRNYVFRVYVMKNVEGEKQTDVEKLLSQAADELIEFFDKKDALQIEDLIFVRPVPSVWEWVEFGGGEARVATFTLTCVVIEETT
jgi:hypothetical protein